MKKKHVTIVNVKQCCIPFQLPKPNLKERPSIMENDLVISHERKMKKRMIKKVV